MRKALGTGQILRVAASLCSPSGSWKRTSASGLSLVDQGVAAILDIASKSHLFAAGRRYSDRTLATPSEVATMYVLDERLNPKKTPSRHLLPMLPSGMLLGPFDGSLYRIRSPKHRSNCRNALPLILCHGVCPSEPRARALSSMQVCSNSHAVIGWFTGRYLFRRASKHSFRVLNIPLMMRTPTSVPPLDWLSYAAGDSSCTFFMCSANLRLLAARLRSAKTATSLSDLRITQVCPSQRTSLTTRPAQ